MTAASIRIEGLSKREGPASALADLDLQVSPGQRVGLLAPPASGKATLARILAGLAVPDAGEVSLDGRSILDDAGARSRLGYLATRPGLDGDRTPRELLRVAGGLHGLSTSETERRLERLLMSVGLEHLGGHAIEHLEPGMRRRLALAYALVSDPPALVAHEPTLGLPPEATRRLLQALEAYSEDRTLLLVTGQPSEVKALCERVVGLEAGQIVVDAGVQELVGDQGQAIDVELAGELPGPALDELREHPAVAALRCDPEDVEADLELWITDPGKAEDVLRLLVEAGAPVASFAPREPDLGALVAEHMEAPL